jgi:hypothetical protein
MQTPIQMQFHSPSDGRWAGSRKKFTAEEDELLRRLVSTNAEKSWNEIASMMRGRTARQVRERYQHYLNPSVNVGWWSSEEDALLLQMFEVYGPQWSVLRQFFNGRSCVNIKNRWTTLVSQARKTTWEQRHEHSTSPFLIAEQPPICLQSSTLELKVRRQSSSADLGEVKIRKMSSSNIPFGNEVTDLRFGSTAFDDVFGEFVW